MSGGQVARLVLTGEYLPFGAPVVTEGRPEEWLNRVEDAMFATTKKHLYKVLEESKGERHRIIGNAPRATWASWRFFLQPPVCSGWDAIWMDVVVDLICLFVFRLAPLLTVLFVRFCHPVDALVPFLSFPFRPLQPPRRRSGSRTTRAR